MSHLYKLLQIGLQGVITPTWLFSSIYRASATVLPTLARLVECAGLQEFLSNEIGLTVSVHN